MIDIKNNNGVTLVVLIITVILMSILVSVVTYSGINSYKDMQVTEFVTHMQLIQAKVDELVEEADSDGLGTDITEEQKNIINLAYDNGEIQDNSDEYKAKYKYLTMEELKSKLDIDGIEDDVLINFDTREVVSIYGVEYEGKKYYTQYKLPNGKTLINSEPNNRNISFLINLKMDGLNANVTINSIGINNGTLSFAQRDSNGENKDWKIITNYTEKGKNYNFVISKAGKYTFKLQDNTDTEKFTEKIVTITLTNKPKTNIELKNEDYNYTKDSYYWAYVEKSGTTYLWIPRFAYDTANNIKFVKGNSSITTDETYIGEEWKIHSKFTDNGEELTGIWVETAQTNGLNMIQLLNRNLQTLKEINVE